MSADDHPEKLADRRRVVRLGGLGVGAAVAVGLALPTLLSRKPAATADGPTRILGDPYNSDTYRRLAAAFDAQSGAPPVQLAFSPRESDETVRQLLLQTFTGAPLPDVAFLSGDVIRIFVERGLLEPLNPIFGDAPPFRAVRIRDAIYGAAFGLSVPVIVFNLLLTRRAGVDAEALPGDWPGILGLARRIRSVAPEVTGGFIEHDNGGAFTFLYLIEAHGGALMDPSETHLGFTAPIGLASLDVLRGFGLAGQAEADMSRRQARRAFAAGRIGVLATMSSVLPSLETSSRGHFELKAVPLPLTSLGGSTPAAGPVAVMFAKGADRKRRAADLIRFAAGPIGQAIIGDTSGYAPANAPDRVGRLGRPLSALARPDRVTDWYTFPGRNSLKISELIQNEMQQVATLQATAGEALAAITAGIEPLLGRGRQT